MVPGGGAFGRISGHECGALISPITFLYKKDSTQSPSLFPHVKSQREDTGYDPGRRLSPAQAGTLILNFQTPELWEISCCCLQAAQSVMHYHSRPDGLRREQLWMRNMKVPPTVEELSPFQLLSFSYTWSTFSSFQINTLFFDWKYWTINQKAKKCVVQMRKSGKAA